MLESVRIQEEQKRNHILNSKAEYSRCTLPRLTAKMGEAEYDEIREEEKKREKEVEEAVKRDIARRKKDRCKKRGKENHETEEIGENMRLKRRKLDTGGQYKTVVQMRSEPRDLKDTEEEDVDGRELKKMKVIEKEDELEKDPQAGEKPADEEEGTEETVKHIQILKDTNIYKILGLEIKDAELEEPIDWQKRREEILERLRSEEEERRKRIEKAARLQKGWELTIECKRLLLEYSNEWRDDEKRVKDRERKEQREKAASKKAAFEEKQKIKGIHRRISDMLESVPKTEAEKIELEMRKKENDEFREMKRVLWRKWRGKDSVARRKDRVPKEVEKVECRLREIEGKINEYKERKAVQLEKRERKKEEWKKKHKMIGQDAWNMMTWLTQFIEENKFEWGKRRERRNEKLEKEYEVWSGMEEGEMIKLI